MQWYGAKIRKQEKMIPFDEYLHRMNQNLLTMSRTAHGVIDTSASADKKDSLLIGSGTQTGIIVAENITDALQFVYDNRNICFQDPGELKAFILKIVSIVNDQIVKPDRLIRSGTDSTKYNYVRIADLETVFTDFCRKLYDRLSGIPYDAVETACFCEYVVNGVGHFFSDGCNKSSMVISSFCLIRAGLPLPVYDSREHYYSFFREIPKPDRVHYVDEDSYRKFYTYYKSICISR